MVQAIRSQIPASSAMVSLANLVQKRRLLGGGAKDSNSRPLTMPSPSLRFQLLKDPNGYSSLVPCCCSFAIIYPFKKEAKKNY